MFGKLALLGGGMIGPLVIGAAILGILAYTFYLGGKGPRAERDAYKAQLATAVQANRQLEADGIKREAAYQSQRDGLAKIESDAKAARERTAELTAKLAMRDAGYKTEIGRLQKEAATPAQKDKATAEAMAILLGLAKARQR